MERNWDTIREILIATEALEPVTILKLSDFTEDQAHEISYHAELLEEAGLVHASISKNLSSGLTQFHIYRLTWPGHELLDAIRNESIWNKTKSTITSKGGSMTFELIKFVAIELAKTAMGL